MATPKIYTGTRCMDTIFSTETGAAAADLFEFVTAGGNNTIEDAVATLSVDNARESILTEMAENQWVTHELVVSDFERIQNRVLRILAERAE